MKAARVLHEEPCRDLRQRTELLMLRAKTRLSYVLNRAQEAHARKCVRQETVIEPSRGSTPEFLKIEQPVPVH